MTAPPSPLDPAANQVQSLFNRIAPVYDDLNTRLSWGWHRVWKLMAVKWAQPQPGDRALDLCCGSGDLALLLADRVGPQGQVIGADFAAAQLAIARQRAAAYPHLPLQWHQADALALPFADQSFHCATLGYGLRNLTDIPQALRELERVLKPGGRGAILDFHRPEAPLGQAFQDWYLARVVVPTAVALGCGPDYAYIAESLARFPQGRQQVALAQAAGFAQAVHYAIAGGLMGVLVVTKA